MNKYLILLIILLISSSIKSEDLYSNKGRLYVYWGWNRSWYSNSDIHFKGDNYDFELSKLKATDRQSPFGFDPYFSFTRITLPQTNFRIGYFINDKIDISIGVDHMKYVLVYNQNTQIDGFIHTNSDFDGDFNHSDFINTYSFLKFEHTDGLNYIDFEINRNDRLLDVLNINLPQNKIQVNSVLGVGAGVLLPKSNVKLWNQERNDAFHLAGYGVSAGAGVDFLFFKYFFIRNEYKVGFINMPDIKTSINPNDKASQKFIFREYFFSFGLTFNPFN